MLKEFNNIIGYDFIKVELERIIDMMTNSKNYKKLGVVMTKGLLLEGEPGVGKTTMAKAFIKASKRNAYTLKKDAANENFSKLIKSTFAKAAKNAPSIVYLDDLDKFSNEDESHINSDEFITIQSCIDDIVGKDVFVLATANELDCIPQSLLRPGRFDKRIRVENPTGEDAEKIVEYYLNKKKLAKDINPKDVARFLDGRSCASLETVINEAGVYAGFEKRSQITMDDIIRSFMRVIYNTPEDLSDKERNNIKRLAIHEAGHTVVSELLNPGSVTIVTIKKHTNTDTGGFTFINDIEEDDDKWLELKYYKNEILNDLGGKAATELLLCEQDTGCAQDIRDARRILENMIDNMCTEGFQYQGVFNRWDDSLDIQSKCYVINSKMEQYYQEAKKMLFDNKEFLVKLSEELTKKITLTFKDIERIKNECRICLNYKAYNKL